MHVAITRARQELRVFSSLRAEQLDLTRTPSEGVRDLKHFMEFAERGARALGEAVFGSVGDFESPFEEAVAKALANKGWRMQSQIGVSAFRIDLGVVDPEAPGSYLAGIECDGATYHRSATARDRDMIREQMLRGLGWNILRIWSTDWWVDADTVIEKIHAQLNTLLDARRTDRALRAKVIPLHGKQGADDKALAPSSETDDSNNYVASQVLYAGVASTKVSSSPEMYQETDFDEAGFSVNPDAFFDDHYVATLTAIIEFVIGREAPLRDDVLARRIARAHGWQRTGSRIQDRVNQLARKQYHFVSEGELTFIWKSQTHLGEIQFRAPASGESRVVEEVSTPELVVLAREIVKSGVQQKSDGMFAMASKLGLQRLCTASKERLANAWDLTTNDGLNSM